MSERDAVFGGGAREEPSLRIWPFFGVAVAWFLSLNIIWVQIVPYTAQPAAMTARAVLGVVAPHWVQKVQLRDGVLSVDTPFQKMVPTGPQGTMQGQYISVDLQARGMTYGLTLFLALLMSAARAGWWWRAVPGIAVLMVAQGFCMAGAMLALAARAVGSAAELGITQWQFDAFNVLYFQSVLVLPTLVPVMIWLWFDWPLVSRLFGRQR